MSSSQLATELSSSSATSERLGMECMPDGEALISASVSSCAMSTMVEKISMLDTIAERRTPALAVFPSLIIKGTECAARCMFDGKVPQPCPQKPCWPTDSP